MEKLKINPNLEVYRVFIPKEKIAKLKIGEEVCLIEGVDGYEIKVLDTNSTVEGFEITYKYIKDENN